MEEDILDIMESDEKAFEQPNTFDKKEPEVKNDDRKETTFKSNKINYWEEADIEGKKIDTDKLKAPGKVFGIAISYPDFNTREAPEEIGEKIIQLTTFLTGKGYALRYDGDSNKLYEKILKDHPYNVITYLPWKKFNVNVKAVLNKPTDEAYHHAAYYHRGYKKLPSPIRTITAREINILVGEDCLSPIKFLLCYSPDGAETVKEVDYKVTGFISFMITVAEMMGIPVFNIKNKDSLKRLQEFINSQKEPEVDDSVFK